MGVHLWCKCAYCRKAKEIEKVNKAWEVLELSLWCTGFDTEKEGAILWKAHQKVLEVIHKKWKKAEGI